MIAEINSWIVEHQAIVVTVGLPALTLIVTQLTALSSERRISENNRKERALQIQMQIAEYRRDWIEKLREQLTEYNNLIATRHLDDSQLSRIPYFISSFQMKLNADEPLAQELISTIVHAAAVAFDEVEETDSSVHNELCEASQKFLKAEWDRLKSDLMHEDQVMSQ